MKQNRIIGHKQKRKMIMRKLIYIATLSIVLANVSYGQIAINWSGLVGFTRDSAGTLPIIDPGQSALVQLLWSPISTPAGATIGGGTLGGELILTSLWLDLANSSEYGEFQPENDYVNPSGYAPGFVYGRIFDGVAAPDPALIIAGSHYYWGPFVPLQEITDPSEPQIYSLNRGATLDDFGVLGPTGLFLDENSNLVVPEPSVMALLGLGGLMLAIRRQRMAA
jgi:hypothetical protein